MLAGAKVLGRFQALTGSAMNVLRDYGVSSATELETHLRMRSQCFS
jgi:hypothetical protein